MNAALNTSASLTHETFRTAAYTVASMLSSGLEYSRRWRDEARFDESILRDLELSLWRIALAWEQVLAGDSEDLMEDVTLEQAGRFPKPLP
jgi:hypothetical protein